MTRAMAVSLVPSLLCRLCGMRFVVSSSNKLVTTITSARAVSSVSVTFVVGAGCVVDICCTVNNQHGRAYTQHGQFVHAGTAVEDIDDDLVTTVLVGRYTVPIIRRLTFVSMARVGIACATPPLTTHSIMCLAAAYAGVRVSTIIGTTYSFHKTCAVASFTHDRLKFEAAGRVLSYVYPEGTYMVQSHVFAQGEQNTSELVVVEACHLLQLVLDRQPDTTTPCLSNLRSVVGKQTRATRL